MSDFTSLSSEPPLPADPASRETLLARVQALEARVQELESEHVRTQHRAVQQMEALRGSEERYRALVESHPDLIARFERSLRHLYVNPAIERATGQPAATFLGRTNLELGMPAELCAQWDAALLTVFETGQPGEIEFDYTTPTGVRAYHSRLLPELGSDGQVETVLCITRDKTVEKQAEQALRESEARYRALAELSPDATLVYLDGRFVYANLAAFRLLGVEQPEGIIGRSGLEFVVPELHAVAAERIKQVLEERSTRPLMESRWRRSDGSVMDVEMAAAAVSWQGAPAIQIVLRDITERKRAEREREASLARFTALIENVPDGLLIETEEGTIFAVNPAFCEVFRIDVTAEALVGADCSRVAEDVRHLLAEPTRFPGRIAETLAGRSPLLGEEVRFADGRVFERDYVPIVSGESHFVGHMWRYRNITERKRAEEAIARSAERLRGLAEAALAIHAVQDVGEMLGVITEQARTLIGAHQASTSVTARMSWARAADAVSFSDQHPDRRVRVQPSDDSPVARLVCETNRPMRMSQAEMEAHPAWRSSGEPGAGRPPLRGWLAAPLVARDGSNLGLIQLSDKYQGEFSEADEATLVQLAHLASVAVENARLYEEAREANRAKSDFLAAMSHELRTPLNAIGGYLELLEVGIHGPLTESQRRAIERITANQRHLLTLINDLLSFARLEAGRIEFDVRPLSAWEMLASLESLISPQAVARGVSYTLDQCAPDLFFRGDEERVRQILLNVVSNAIKFTPAGGWVTLSCACDAEWVYLRVQDNGVGIPLEEQERIFDPFQQVGRRLNQPREGVGLGLAISRDLARAMAGDLTVRSVPDQGSTFALHLPRSDPPADFPRASR